MFNVKSNLWALLPSVNCSRPCDCFYSSGSALKTLAGSDWLSCGSSPQNTLRMVLCLVLIGSLRLAETTYCIFENARSVFNQKHKSGSKRGLALKSCEVRFLTVGVENQLTVSSDFGNSLLPVVFPLTSQEISEWDLISNSESWISAYQSQWQKQAPLVETVVVAPKDHVAAIQAVSAEASWTDSENIGKYESFTYGSPEGPCIHTFYLLSWCSPVITS